MRSAAVVLIALTLVVSGCGRQEVMPAASVTAVVVDGGDRALAVGESVTLSATVTVTGNADTTVGWTSGDTSVVTIDDTGLATATAIGTATITATSTYDAQTNDSISLTVTGGPEVLSVVIDGGDRSLSFGQSVTLSATVTVTGDADTTVAWTSSDTSVVTIDDTGLATAVAAGAAIITATSSHDPRTSDSMKPPCRTHCRRATYGRWWCNPPRSCSPAPVNRPLYGSWPWPRTEARAGTRARHRVAVQRPGFEVSASVAGLPRLSASAEVGVDIELDIGVDVRPGGGSNPNRLDVEPIATFDLVTTGALTDATFSVTSRCTSRETPASSSVWWCSSGPARQFAGSL